MNPQVEAALIAAIATLVGVGGTVLVALRGFRATKQATDATIFAQREQLDRTEVRTLNERFATAAGQLGSDKPPEVRLAGVYAMAGLADDWKENRQTCVDVLCGYLRMPYEPDPGRNAAEPQPLAVRASREVRHTVIRVITAHLQDGAPDSWQGLNLDFTGVVFDGGDFSGAEFSGGEVNFNRARFPGGMVSFRGARFSGGTVSFNRTQFPGGAAYFDGARFSGGTVSFVQAQFSDGTVSFSRAHFSGGTVDFRNAQFSGGTVYFGRAQFSCGTISFDDARFSDGMVDFRNARFPGATVSFSRAHFSGGTVDFRNAQFSGGTADFSGADEWSSPPVFSWTDTPPPGVKLPKKEDQSRAVGDA
jgi:uncharacterized protein YjbI with pentapeptide repeats